MCSLLLLIIYFIRMSVLPKPKAIRPLGLGLQMVVSGSVILGNGPLYY